MIDLVYSVRQPEVPIDGMTVYEHMRQVIRNNGRQKKIRTMDRNFKTCIASFSVLIPQIIL